MCENVYTSNYLFLQIYSRIFLSKKYSRFNDGVLSVQNNFTRKINKNIMNYQIN